MGHVFLDRVALPIIDHCSLKNANYEPVNQAQRKNLLTAPRPLIASLKQTA
jgi:hypothetical protein